jgi:hypothetical protein
MAQQHHSLFQIDSFEVYEAKVRGYKRYLKLSFQEAKDIIEVLLSGLAQGKVEGFTVTVYEELGEDDRGVEEGAAQIIV